MRPNTSSFPRPVCTSLDSTFDELEVYLTDNPLSQSGEPAGSSQLVPPRDKRTAPTFNGDHTAGMQLHISMLAGLLVHTGALLLIFVLASLVIASEKMIRVIRWIHQYCKMNRVTRAAAVVSSCSWRWS